MDRRDKKIIGLNTWIALIFVLVVSIVSAQDSKNLVEAHTFLRPKRSIEIIPTERGVIRELLVKPGDEVKKDQILLKLNSETIEAQLAAAKAAALHTGQILSATAERDLAKNRYEIMLKLKGRGTTGDAELKRGKATLDAAEGALKSAREVQELAQFRVRTIEGQLEERILRSPIDGMVVDVSKDVAESVALTSSEQEYLIRVVDLTQLEARAHLPFRVAEQLSKGQELRVQLVDTAKTTANGIIEFISPVVNPASETVEVRLVFDNASGRLQSGVPARVQVTIQDKKGEEALEQF